MNTKKSKLLLGTQTALILLFLSGCATTAPRAKYTNSISPTERIDADDNIEVSVQSSNGIFIAEYDLLRIRQTLLSELSKSRSASGIINPERDLKIDVSITRYDKGNAAARAMLAGLGPMHIDASVKSTDKDSGKVNGEFVIDKDFAWGGIYGASTSMEDLEQGLCSGIAKALVRNKE